MRSGRRVTTSSDHQGGLIWYAQDDSFAYADRYFEIIDWCQQQWGLPSEGCWSWYRDTGSFIFDSESKLLMFKLRFA
jgi:hypothetical protein